MVLGAVTSGRRLETEWITRDMGRVFPREWDRFVVVVPESERAGDRSAGYPSPQMTTALFWPRHAHHQAG
jgi:proline iminopeptidase